jgi:cobalt-zinc-cadmium efflux system outer membrane protein
MFHEPASAAVNRHAVARGCRLAAVLLTALLSGCAQLPADRGRLEVAEQLSRQGAPAVLGAAGSAELDPTLLTRLDEPLSADAAVEIAFLLSPRVKMALARLGLASAELFDSQRPRNPAISLGKLGTGAAAETSVGLHLLLSDLMLLPARRDIGELEWQAAIAETVAMLLEEASEVRHAYYHYLAASQVAAMRAAVAEASALSAELAVRFHAAGNISALQLAREQANATLARHEAANARGERLEARLALAERLGLAGRSNRWSLPEQLPLPGEDVPDLSTLLAQAHAQRADLAAARLSLDAASARSGLSRRTAWLGELELELEHESEDDGDRNGAALGWELPLFSQGQGGIARAESGRELALQQIEMLELAIEADVRVGVARLANLREIIDGYRNTLIPQQRDIVAGEMQRYNFMLIGVFELIEARKAEFDTYQSYFEAIRDYWITQTELEQAIGGPLPKPAIEQLTPAVDEIVRPQSEGGHDHHGHH